MNVHALDVLEFGKVRQLLVDHATSGLGKRRAGQVEPLTDVEEVGKLIAETTELKALLAPDCNLPIGGLHDLFPLLDKLEQGEEILNGEEILFIADTLRAGRTVKAYLGEVEDGFSHLQSWATAIHTYEQIEEEIGRTFNESGVIKSGATSKLKAVRRSIEQARGRIRSKLQALMRSQGMSSYIQDTGIRESKGRPTIAVKAQYAGRVPGARRDRSDSGGTVFIEPEAVRGLVDELEIAQNEEKEEMARILRHLTALIAVQDESLRQTLEVLAHIDMTYAKVRLSRKYDMHPPALNTEGMLALKEARHPLLLVQQYEDEMADEIVPIDVRLGDDFTTLIITGPNTGGKTITLKTIGLLTLMAQAGLHVPAAAGSSLAVFQQVWADIGDEQSIEQSLSTFSSHLNHIAQILGSADAQSLVLLDELGGGTDPAEGAALARSILGFLHERQVRTAVTTHISQLKELGYTTAGVENASIEFDLETLKPTHRLMVGTPGNSNALAIARRLGLPLEVIERAEASATADESDALIEQLQSARMQATENREAALQARRQAELLEEEGRQRLEELALQQTEKQSAADEGALLNLVRQRLTELQQGETTRKGLLRSLRQLGQEIDARLLQAPGGSAAAALQAGDEVYVRRLDRIGTLNQIDVKAGKAVVQFGALPMTVGLEEVETT